MSLTVAEKKSRRWIAIIWILAISVYGLGLLLPVLAYKPNNIRVDLSSFGGRVISQKDIKPGTFTIEVPYAEAMTWGKDAILSYGEKGIEIWRPDNATSGVFQHYGDVIKTGLYYFEVQRNDKEIHLRSRFALWGPIALGLCVLVLAISFSACAREKMHNSYDITP